MRTLRLGGRKALWANDRWLVFAYDKVFVSADGVAFQSYPHPVQGTLIAWNGERYLAMGREVFSSEDGTSWTNIGAAPIYQNGAELIWNGERFLVFDSSKVHSSTDGQNWTTHEVRNGRSCYDMLWSGSSIVCGYFDGFSTRYLYRSADLGKTWTTAEMPIGRLFAADNTLYALSDNEVRTSVDGVSWSAPQPLSIKTESGADLPVNIRETLWTGERFYATFDDGRQTGALIFSGLLWSDDGINWTRIEGTYNKLIYDLAAGSERQVLAVGDEVTHFDGSQWWIRGINDSINLRPAYSIDRFLIGENLRFSSHSILVSLDDGSSWKRLYLGLNNGDLVGVTWTGDQYIAVFSNGNIFTSPNGLRWTSRFSDAERPVGVFFNGTFAVITQTGKTVLTSPDGITWTSHVIPGDGSNYRSFAWSETTTVIGERSQLAVTEDGETWIASSALGEYLTYNGVSFANLTGGRVHFSLDGKQWRGFNDDMNRSLFGITWGDGAYLGHDQNLLWQSLDGTNWAQPISLGTSFSSDGTIISGQKNFIIADFTNLLLGERID